MATTVELYLNPLASLLDFLGRLLLWPFSWPLRRIHALLDEHIYGRPGFWGGLWRLFHEHAWQRSARFNARTWVVSFVIFWPLAHRFGHAWWINLGITLLLDTVAYLFHKEWVWSQRQIDLNRSVVLSYSFTLTTFGANLVLAWALLNETSLGNALSKTAMAAIGVMINPAVFKFRDKVALRDRRKEAGSA